MRKTGIRRAELALLVFLALVFSWGTAMERRQQAIAGGLIRLHVVANSDGPEDQTIKLAVRDTVLEEAETLLTDASGPEEARKILGGNLDRLEAAANETLRAGGSAQRAAVTLRRELFGTRDYDTFSLPGGYYDALRVTIGSGSGHNWWCVVYPQICTAATMEDRHAVAAMGGLDPETVAIIEGDGPEYELKFRSMELLEDLLGWFRGGAGGIPPAR